MVRTTSSISYPRPGDIEIPIQRGDTLWSIAQRTGLDVSTLLVSNGGSQKINAGSHLVVKREDRLSLMRREASKGDYLPPLTVPNSKAVLGSHRFRVPIEELRMEHRSLLDAIRWVETSCITPPPVGDNGKSIGPLQISAPYHYDAWSHGRERGERGSKRTLEKLYREKIEDVKYSEETCLRYWIRYCPSALLFGNDEVLARMHNGGPRYMTLPKTLRYWKKIRTAMRQKELQSRRESDPDLFLHRQEWSPVQERCHFKKNAILFTPSQIASGMKLCMNLYNRKTGAKMKKLTD